jgi:hypothetical protein
MVYEAEPSFAPSESSRRLTEGFSVAGLNLLDVVSGNLDHDTLYDRVLNREIYVQNAGGEAIKVITRDGPTLFPSFFKTVFSADGAYAIVDATPGRIDRRWLDYQDPFLSRQVSAALDGRTEDMRRLLQLFLVRLEDGSARPLLNAPMTTRTGTLAAFAPDGNTVVAGPTHLPPGNRTSEDDDGKAFVLINRKTGALELFDLPDSMPPDQITSLNWNRRGIEITTQNQDWRYSGLEWRRLPRIQEKSGLSIDLVQDCNTPPVLAAVDAVSKRSEPLLELNPILRSRRLGRVENIHWLSRSGRKWNGLLYRPVDELPGKRYPLVIQTHGHAPTSEFSLYGKGGFQPGLGPAYAADLAQPLSNANIAVLHIEDQMIPNVTDTPREPEEYSLAYEGAIDHLDAASLIRRDRVGLNGYSRTGWHVEWALTHGDFDYAAAIVFDNMDAGYLQSAILSWAADYAENNIGSPPFGRGLEQWLERSPPFQAERVITPLQIYAAAGGLPGIMFSGWEMFTRLRKLEKPVELFAVPNIEKGAHGLQNPRQCQVVLNRTLDWWLFWLLDTKRVTPRKQDQYAQWDRLRAQRDAITKAPRHERLDWNSHPSN